MKIYVETLFLLNGFMDYLILMGTKKVLYRDSKPIRIVFASMIGSLTTFHVFFSMKNSFLFFSKILFSILMNFIAFGKKDLLKCIIYFYLISIILGGSFYLIGLQKNYYMNMIVLMIVAPILIHNFVKEYKKYKILQKDTYKVTIVVSKKNYEFHGFIDTGNQLQSPFSHKPVILIDIPLPCVKSIMIPYKALNSQGVIECVVPDMVIINDKIIQNCLIGLAKDKLMIDGCNCILPFCLKEEL